MKSALIILEAKNNRFSSNDQKLINFISKSYEKIGILTVNCNYACAKTLKKVNEIYLLATKIPINVDRNSCACALLVAGLILKYDITVADTDTCYHNVICRAAAAVNRYVISNVYDILGDNIFVRTANAGMVNQHVGFKCDKPWLISVKLSLIADPDVGMVEKKQPEEKKCDANPDTNLEVKDQNVDNVGSNKDVIGGKDKEVDNLKDNLNSKDNQVNENKEVKEDVVRCEESSSEVATPRPTITNVDKDGLKETEIKPCEDKPKEMGVDNKKETNEVVKPIETVPDVRYQIINFPIRKQLELISYSKPEVNKELPDLSKADIVIAGGRSFGTEENFMIWLKPLALRLGAAIGATRGAVELGCAPVGFQIGSAGSTIAPKLYIAFGISGSDHHMIGVKDAKTIVAVNTDKDAAIMSMADYSLTIDMFDVISGMMKWLDSNKNVDINNLIQNLNRNQSKPVQSESNQIKPDIQEVKPPTN
ncbi:electron transfer flavoprotein subunit alpha/FixB family protein [Candidatus Hodgkinia cicadicola]